jgi:hypothetical protein
MPPKPPRSFCASSLKFQVTGSALLLSELVAVDIRVSVTRLRTTIEVAQLAREGRGLSSVMPGFMPGIHVFANKQDVDGRDKPGHDDRLQVQQIRRLPA